MTNSTTRNVLMVHPNFPGQFRHLAAQWARRSDLRVVGLGSSHSPGISGLHHLRYRASDHRRQAHPYLQAMEQAVRVGQAAARVYLHLKKQGFIPDVVLAHPGWGDTLYLRDVFPDARLIHFCEWYYNAHGADVNFDPEFKSTLNDHGRIRTRNALHALNLTLCDEGVSPTAWQRSIHPPIFQPKIQLVHEGIDTDKLGPDPQAQLTLPDGTRVKAGDPIITYVARNLEPYRGIHHFLRALAIIQKRHPTCHALIVGGDEVSYGERPKDARNWREKLTREIQLDPKRTHFLGQLHYNSYRRVLQLSAAHVYLTYPFVLSWSMLEAMASGCVVIGADTAPVREVLRHGENGWRVDFFDDVSIAGRVVEVLNDPVAQEPLRRQARADMIAGYSLQQGLAGYERLLGITSFESIGPLIDSTHTLRQQMPSGRNQKPPLIGGQPLRRQIA